MTTPEILTLVCSGRGSRGEARWPGRLVQWSSRRRLNALPGIANLAHTAAFPGNSVAAAASQGSGESRLHSKLSGCLRGDVGLLCCNDYANDSPADHKPRGSLPDLPGSRPGLFHKDEPSPGLQRLSSAGAPPTASGWNPGLQVTWSTARWSQPPRDAHPAVPMVHSIDPERSELEREEQLRCPSLQPGRVGPGGGSW